MALLEQGKGSGLDLCLLDQTKSFYMILGSCTPTWSLIFRML